METRKSRRIVQMPLSEIQPYDRNPRDNDAAVEDVVNSIHDFGFRNPLIVDSDHVIIAGHTRWKAAHILGLERVPVIVADDMSESEARAYRIADNASSSKSTWDYNLLETEVEELPDYDMERYGLDMEDIAAEQPDDIEGVQDVPIPEAPEEPTTKRGQIFRLGGHVLMCGDCTDGTDMDRLIGAAAVTGGGVDMLMTDPPYNVGYEGKTDEQLTIANDQFADRQAYTDFLTRALGRASEVMRPGAAAYIWYASWRNRECLDACESAGIGIKQTLVWVKSIFTLGHMDYQWQQEPCLYGWRNGGSHYFIHDRSQSTVTESEPLDVTKLSADEARQMLRDMIDATETDVIHASKPNANRDHPTMKPVPMIARLITNSSRRNNSVLDIFGGSGSTLMACEQTGRRCITMELDPRYCDVIIRRWEEFTGHEVEPIA